VFDAALRHVSVQQYHAMKVVSVIAVPFGAVDHRSLFAIARRGIVNPRLTIISDSLATSLF